MRKQQGLSSDKEKEVKFIIMFTIGFVIVAAVLLVAGYAALSVTGVLGNSTSSSPTPDQGPTAKPTWAIIGVTPDPTEPPTPTPFLPIPTPTPTPIPTPAPMPLGANLDVTEAGSYKYILNLRLVPGNQPVDMAQTTLRITDGLKDYCNFGYPEAVYNLDGLWLNSNNNTVLEPGETFQYTIRTYYDFDIPLRTETQLFIYQGDLLIFKVPLPALQSSGY